METTTVTEFGTYNVPSTSVSLSASYTVPGISTKEMIEKIIAEENKSVEKSAASLFDQTLKAVIAVPKTA